MLVPGKDFKIPDFDSQASYEAEGWIRGERADVYCEIDQKSKREAPMVCTFGTAELDKKFATASYYNNDELEITIMTVDFFDQGVVYIEWWPENRRENEWNSAIKLKEGSWRVRKYNEGWDLRQEKKIISGKPVIHKITLLFFKIEFANQIFPTVALEIIKQN